MLTELEKFIFPDTCEVLQLAASQEFVFPIFKNGSSSLRRAGIPVSQDQIPKISTSITVFIRDPRSRFVSGVNTYVQHVLRTDPTLDKKTILHFVGNYLFLNRHYAPQFFWIMNLARFIDSDTTLRLEQFENIHNYTDYHDHAGVESVDSVVAEAVENFDQQKLELYYFLDETLRERTGHVFTYSDLVWDIKMRHPNLLETVFDPPKRLHSVLP